ncbi:glycosyltransferase family 4 protein [Aliivibrio finisterrensis]|uniref:Glycosyltransferase family 1 protein n=1 Tax=Aliivibrio finisterrensis TaxID=511998 RepID=A0ABY0I264_9GAMM|nr:glycosyltransferase family 4 protein [Aliivibrio finisterrensis]RYU61830.1 glycosyltransferase family 1 protein [Aliivibrio finisterrensis]RYU80706.1 glycosyltransferase family 1 protein [Aliivibrio finisterrensis]
MKTLQVTTVANTLNAFLLPFAKAFKQQGWQVDAAASNIVQFENIVAEHDNCFDIQFCRNPLKIKQLFKSLKQIRKLLEIQQYDVVHVHTPIAAFLTRIAVIGIKKTKIFYTAHGFHYINTNPVWKNILFYLAEKLAGFKTDHLFVINQDDYQFAKQKQIVPEQAITFIHGIGVNPDGYRFSARDRQIIRAELKLSDNTFMLLQVAELNDNKNHQVVLQALALFKQQNPNSDIRYVIVGEGRSQEYLVRQVNLLNLSSSVIFLGQRSDVPALLSACDALSLSSKREGLPRCMLEAMCMQKPIMASNIRGCNDLLSSGAGILVDHNELQQWAKAIQQLYRDPELRHRMGLVGFQLIEQKYQQDKIVDAVLNVYKREFN